MNGVHELNILQFSIVYILLIIVLAIMKKCKINQTKLLIIASIRMTVQLVLAGLLLTYIFKNPHPLFTILYIFVMTCFAIYTVLSRNKEINTRFKIIVGLSLSVTGVCVVIFFITIVLGVNIFNPQYTIPISGMIIGNAMTGISLGLKTFNQNIKTERIKIDTLINMGATPSKILIPFVNNALETALLPTLNSMLGMGIISLPGMMTGQILSGTLPSTAILYQIAIIIAICTVTCLSVFCSLYFGYRTLYNERNQMISFDLKKKFVFVVKLSPLEWFCLLILLVLTALGIFEFGVTFYAFICVIYYFLFGFVWPAIHCYYNKNLKLMNFFLKISTPIFMLPHLRPYYYLLKVMYMCSYNRGSDWLLIANKTIKKVNPEKFKTNTWKLLYFQFLASINYAMNDKEMALKYIDIAKELSPNDFFAKEMERLKKMFSKVS